MPMHYLFPDRDATFWRWVNEVEALHVHPDDWMHDGPPDPVHYEVSGTTIEEIIARGGLRHVPPPA